MSANIDQFNYVGYQVLIKKALSSDDASATLNIANSATELNVIGKDGVSSVSLSLSPEAQQAIAEQQIALALISTNHQNQDDINFSINNGQKNSNTYSNINSSSSPIDVSSVTNSLESIITAGQQALKTDPLAVFTSFVEQSGGAQQYISGYGDADLENSFVAAFNNGTLKVQDAAEVPALGYTETDTFTGSGGSSSAGWNSNVQAQLDTADGTYSVGQILPGFGGLYVTWANPTATA